jgi:FkbM family methyltransferase
MPSVRNLIARGLRRCLGPGVPSRARLAFDYRVARVAGCEPELALLHRLGANRGTAIDAGANQGLFTYRLAGLYDRVHAFEINPALAGRLSRLAPWNVTVHPFGLSSRAGSNKLFTPIYRGRLLDGWASLERGNCPGAERYVESPVTVRPLDSFGLEGITFLKADVEGHEVELLAGARETLRRNRPVVLVEIKEANLTAVRAAFAEMGYAARPFAELTGAAGSAGNFLFLPG